MKQNMPPTRHWPCYQCAFLWCLLISFYSPLYAQETLSSDSSDFSYDDLFSLSLEELVELRVTVASSNSETVFNSVSTVTVIQRAQIDKYGFRTVREAIATLSGVAVLRTYFKQSIPTARSVLQDNYANKVLVMINKVPTSNGATGEAILERINIHDIERIEVLKGPASVLYGTNAYSGAINLVLRDSKQAQGHAYVGVGSEGQNTAGISNSFMNEAGNAGVFISANFENSEENDFSFVDEQGNSAPITDFNDMAAITLLGHYNTHELLINTYQGEEGYLGVVPRLNFGSGNQHALDGYLAAYKYQYSIDNESNVSLMSNYEWNKREFSRDAANDEQGVIEALHIINSIKYKRPFYENFNFELGIDHDYREIEVFQFELGDGSVIDYEGNLAGQDVSETSVFSQVGYQKDRWKGLVGSRVVDNELFGENVSSRGTLVYSFSDTSSVKFIAGQSYRSPSLFALYIVGRNNIITGNPDLNPEKSTSYEVSYIRAYGHYFLQANAYYATYDNKIYRKSGDAVLPDGSGVVVQDTTVYANGEAFTAQGLELETRYSNDQLDAFFNVNVISGDDGDEVAGSDHYNFKYVPDFTLSAGMSKRVKGFLFSFVANYTDSAQGPEQEVDSSLAVDLMFGYTQQLGNRAFHHSVRLNNASDESVTVAEYARRRGLNEVRMDLGRVFTYEVSVKF